MDAQANSGRVGEVGSALNTVLPMLYIALFNIERTSMFVTVTIHC